MEAGVNYLEVRGKRVFGLLGHSKGGTNVILYASRHDDSGVRIVNVCGRCHLKASGCSGCCCNPKTARTMFCKPHDVTF